MIAAIYARKSTEQNGVADEAKSVQRQIEHATGAATDSTARSRSTASWRESLIYR
jgi:hypothetical protein